MADTNVDNADRQARLSSFGQRVASAGLWREGPAAPSEGARGLYRVAWSLTAPTNAVEVAHTVRRADLRSFRWDCRNPLLQQSLGRGSPQAVDQFHVLLMSMTSLRR
ncbi:hypothetical protein GCM10010392_31840 [Streptomyces clavifer]|nr:hypothetical protein GCM10010392_31840 [Streptomyces clavifer]